MDEIMFKNTSNESGLIVSHTTITMPDGMLVHLNPKTGEVRFGTDAISWAPSLRNGEVVLNGGLPLKEMISHWVDKPEPSQFRKSFQLCGWDANYIVRLLYQESGRLIERAMRKDCEQEKCQLLEEAEGIRSTADYIAGINLKPQE